MNHWCESCARKNLCYVVDNRPKCFVPITNTASGTPYLVGISPISRDSHEITRDESNSSGKPNNSEIPTGSADTQTYITEDRDTRILDAWQVKQMQDGKE